jgi:hypothetical protein
VVTFLYADEATFADSQTWSGLNVTGHNREVCELRVTLFAADQPLVTSTASLAIGGFTVPVCTLQPVPATTLFSVTGAGPLSVSNCLFLFADDTHSLTVRYPIVSISQGPLSFTNCEIRGGVFNISPVSLPNTELLTFTGNRFVSVSVTNSSLMLLRYNQAATNYAPRKIERCSFVNVSVSGSSSVGPARLITVDYRLAGQLRRNLFSVEHCHFERCHMTTANEPLVSIAISASLDDPALFSSGYAANAPPSGDSFADGFPGSELSLCGNSFEHNTFTTGVAGQLVTTTAFPAVRITTGRRAALLDLSGTKFDDAGSAGAGIDVVFSRLRPVIVAEDIDWGSFFFNQTKLPDPTSAAALTSEL